MNTTTDTRPISLAGQRWLDRPATDIGPATPAPVWCLPGTEPEWERLTDEFGGGAVCTWFRYFPPENDGVGADVWIRAEDRIVDGRILRTAPQIHYSESPSNGVTPDQARRFILELLKAADKLDQLDS